jgi:CRP-like cAMP-binding protein
MTKREFLEAIVDAEALEVELRKFAAEELEKMDKALAKRKAKQSAKALANAPLIEQIKENLLSDEPLLASVTGEYLGVSVQKASALLRQMVADGIADVKDVKVLGKGIQKGYTLAGSGGKDEDEG